jgi:peptidoglycan hydrolase-like protein with peptidoglycan-binding domain
MNPKYITGYFGWITEEAVKKFQARYGIPSTGYVGSLTRAKLEKM